MAPVKVFQRETKLRTAGGLTVTDITEDVQAAVRESGVQEGIVCIYSPHTTCCVRVNELESGFLEDCGAAEAARFLRELLRVRSSATSRAPERYRVQPGIRAARAASACARAASRASPSRNGRTLTKPSATPPVKSPGLNAPEARCLPTCS